MILNLSLRRWSPCTPFQFRVGGVRGRGTDAAAPRFKSSAVTGPSSFSRSTRRTSARTTSPSRWVRGSSTTTPGSSWARCEGELVCVCVCERERERARARERERARESDDASLYDEFTFITFTRSRRSKTLTCSLLFTHGGVLE